MRKLVLLLSLVLVAFPARPAPAPRAQRDRPVVALVLAGGSALGLAHIGVIKVLEEQGIPIDMVVGTSMGAIVGGLYAVGYTVEDLERIVFSADWTELFSEDSKPMDETYQKRMERARYFARVGFDWDGFRLGGGYLTGWKILRLLDALTLGIGDDVDFDSLPRRYRAVSTDLERGDRVVHERGPIADVMRASMSIPGVFAPYEFRGCKHADGMLVANLPVDVARSLGADLVIAVEFTNKKSSNAKAFDRSPIAPLSRSLDILVRTTEAAQRSAADLVISVDVSGFDASNFDKAKEIAARGEEQARARGEDLAAFRARAKVATRTEGAARTSGAAPVVSAREAPTVSAVSVRGGSSADRAWLRSFLEPLIGKPVDPAALDPAFQAIDRDGRFDSVRLSLDPSTGALTARISREREDDAYLGACLSYSASYSRFLVSNLTFAPGVVVRGLPTDRSRFEVSGELVDAPGVEACFSQGLYGTLRADAFYAFRREFDVWLGNDTLGYEYQTVSQLAGLQLAFELAPGFELSAGCRYDWVLGARYPEGFDGDSVDQAAIFFGRAALSDVDAHCFPSRGLTFRLESLSAYKGLLSERSFATLETSGGLYIPVSDDLSFNILWIAGTDFSKLGDEGNAAPRFYQSDLSSRALFPGHLQVTERIGHHVYGAGLGVQYRLGLSASVIEVPAFFVARGACGAVLPELSPASGATRLHWNCAIGAGIRASDAFAIMLRGGVCRNTSGDYLPFVALDLGSIGF